MKVVLLNPPQFKNKITRDMAGGLGFDASSQTLLPPLDLAILASRLRQKEFQVKIIDPEAEKKDTARTIFEIKSWQPEAVIATVSLPTLKDDIEFLKRLKKVYRGRIIAKTAISFKPLLKEILKKSRAEICLLGENDLEIDKIILGKSRRGTAYLKNNKLMIFPAQPVENLDQLPLPSRDLLNNRLYRYPLLGKKCTIVQTSRGCPFPCAYYCPYPLVQGRKWRAMSPQRVYQELDEIVRNHKIKKVLFRDATFTLDRQRVVEICQKIIKGRLKLSWWCETRVNCLDEKLLKIMKKAGCQGINIGVETGDPKVMEIQGKPGVNLTQLKNLNRMADKISIKLHFLLLIGLPKETRQSLYLTFKMIKELKPYSLGVTVVTPYPGTPLYWEALKKGWLETQDWSFYSGNLATMHTDNLKSWEIKFFQRFIQLELFLLEKGISGKLGLWLMKIFFKIWSL